MHRTQGIQACHTSQEPTLAAGLSRKISSLSSSISGWGSNQALMVMEACHHIMNQALMVMEACHHIMNQALMVMEACHHIMHGPCPVHPSPSAAPMDLTPTAPIPSSHFPYIEVSVGDEVL